MAVEMLEAARGKVRNMSNIFCICKQFHCSAQVLVTTSTGILAAFSFTVPVGLSNEGI